MRVLVLNAGSSSLKASLVVEPGDEVTAAEQVDWSPDAAASAERAAAVSRVIEAVVGGGAGRVVADAVGYRVVHGGTGLSRPTRIDEAVLTEIERLDELAPLHNRVAAETIRAARSVLPDVPHVACFDTAFHATLPEEAFRYALPPEWTDRFGIRRYGFHGLSAVWSVERAAALLGARSAELELVVAHLGSGCSITAVSGGRSVDTSMGFTPLDGIVMGTRPGALDAGILVHLLRQGVTTDELADGLAHRSGLLGLSGGTAGARELEERARSGDARARLALAVFVRRAAAGIAAASTALRRFDALVFTGGIGENSAAVRESICERLKGLGVGAPRDAAPGSDELLSAAGDSVAVLRVAAREELTIARSVAELLTTTE